MQKVYLICGVPGSGKSWVCEQLKDKFEYVSNDAHIGENFEKAIFHAAKTAEKPILADCPFGERVLRDHLLGERLNVVPVFIVESPDVVSKRYFQREHHSPGQNVLTRCASIGARAAEWKAFRGTSEQVLEHLRSL